MNHNSGHSRDDQEVGMAHEVKSPKKPASIFLNDDGVVLVIPNKLSDRPEMLQKIAMEFFFNGISSD